MMLAFCRQGVRSMRHLLKRFSFTILLGLGCGMVAVSQLSSVASDAEPATAAASDSQNRPSARSGARFGLSQPLPRTPAAVRIATYNTLNLFDDVDDPTLQGEFDDRTLTTSPERCAKLAEAIRSIDADILALQEIESLEALKWFRDRWLNDAGYAHLTSLDVGYYRGVECSVMSRFEITASKVWLNESLDTVHRPGLGWSPVP